MQFRKASLAASLLLAVASSATAGDVPSALDRIERHYLCRAQGCFDPLRPYDNAAQKNVQFQTTEGWTAPSGLTCTNSSAYNSSCIIYTVNKDALKAALNMTVDDELFYLVGNRTRVGRLAWNTHVIPFVIKEVAVTDAAVVIYGGDRPYQSYGFSTSEGISIFP